MSTVLFNYFIFILIIVNTPDIIVNIPITNIVNVLNLECMNNNIKLIKEAIKIFK